MRAPESPGPAERVRCHLLLSGRVQGVGFRFFAVRQARSLGVAGFVRNMADGRVEAEVEGMRVAVDAFIDQMTTGPSGAAVRDVAVAWIAPRGEEGFRIG